MSTLYRVDQDTQGSGSYIEDFAGEALPKHSLVYRDGSNLWRLADADDATKMPILGITLEAIVSGLKGRVMLNGYVADTAWSWTVGSSSAVIYASGTPGGLTQAAPALVRVVGTAYSATSIMFNPSGVSGLGGGDPEHTADYIIWNLGVNYYAKNSHSGAIEFTGASVAALIILILAAHPTFGGEIYDKTIGQIYGYINGARHRDEPLREHIGYPASYIVWVEGSTYYAKNGHTGQVSFSGTAGVSAIIQSCNNALTQGGSIFIKNVGVNYVLETPYPILGDNIQLLSNGAILVASVNQTGGISPAGDNIVIDGLIIDGGKLSGLTLPDGIYVTRTKNHVNLRITNTEIRNCRKGFVLAAAFTTTNLYCNNLIFRNCTFESIYLNDVRGGFLNNISSYESGGNSLDARDCDKLYVTNFISVNNIVVCPLPITLRDITNSVFKNIDIGGTMIPTGNAIDLGKTTIAPSHIIFQNIHQVNSALSGLAIFEASYIWVLDSSFEGNTRNGIVLGSALASHIYIRGNLLKDNGWYGFDAAALAAGSIFVENGNEFVNNSLGNLRATALTNSKIRGNIGYVTEASGSATIVQGTTSIAVTHGLAATPTRVQITPTSALYGKFPYVSAKGATTFTITTDSVVGAQAVVGALADDGGARTNETAAANNATANDMTLLPAVPAVGDAYYFGVSNPFSKLELNIGTQGVGVWTVAWEYWNGSAWTAVAGLTDGTTALTAAVGNRVVTFTLPTDWALKTETAISAYWLRVRVATYTSVVLSPLGTQCWKYPNILFDWRAVLGDGN